MIGFWDRIVIERLFRIQMVLSFADLPRLILSYIPAYEGAYEVESYKKCN